MINNNDFYNKMKFKQYRAEPKSNWLKRLIQSQHTKKTIIYIAIGALAGFLFLYIADGRHQDVMKTSDILNNMLIGGLFGLFITNSPCAKNRC